MPEAYVGPLRELGCTVDASAVQALFAPALAQQCRDGVDVHADLAYGPDARHRLDVFVPQGQGPYPVLSWWHGGGFVRGSKEMRHNVGWWGARAGVVVVLPSYRLAPEARWPSGPEDVVAAWSWIRSSIRSFRGNPDRIVLGGESAGAAHVAAACLMRRFQPPDWRVAGAVLLSGPYDAHLERLARTPLGIPTPDPRNDPYIGSELPACEAASIVEQIDAAPFPLWIGAAERDLIQMQVQAGALFARLVTQHGFQPDLHWLRDHNHFSPALALGTDDRSLEALLLDFLQRATNTCPG